MSVENPETIIVIVLGAFLFLTSSWIGLYVIGRMFVRDGTIDAWKDRSRRK